MKIRSMYYFIIAIIAVTLTSCSGPGKTEKESKLNVKLGKVNAWLNLMPGSKERFHVKGYLDISSDTEIPADSIIISEILIFQNEKLIYNFVPATAFENQADSAGRSIFFSEPEEAVLKAMPDSDYPINIQVFLLYSGKKLALELSGLKVEKVY